MVYGNVLECSADNEDMVELVRYEEGKRNVLADATVQELEGNRRKMWLFIEEHIGSANCSITKNAEIRIFGKEF